MFQQVAGAPRKLMQPNDAFTITTEREDASAAEQADAANTDAREASRGLPLALSLLFWVAVVLTAAVAEHGADLLSFSFWFSAGGMSIVALAALPAIGAFILSSIVQQLRDLGRQNAEVQASIARLSEPEPVLSGKIVSIRHAVHKELTSLNEHLDRSLNKTSEIETAIKREVTALENSFAENERRLLGLVQELARQRETVIITTEQVTDTVKTSRETLNGELAHLATQVMEAGNYARGVVEEVGFELKNELAAQSAGVAESLRQAIDEKIAPLSVALGEQVHSIEALLSTGGDGLITAIENHGEKLASDINSAWKRISGDLENQSRLADSTAERLVKIVDQSLESNVNHLESRIKSASIEIRSVLDKGAEQAAQKIVEIANSSTTALDGRIDTLQSRIDTQMQRFGHLMDDATSGFIPVLQQHNDKLERAIELEAAFEKSTTRLSNVLTEQAGAFVDVLSHNVSAFQQQFSDQANIISEGLLGKLDRAVVTLEDGSRRFETTLLDVQDTISLASDRLTIAVAEHNAEFAQRVNQIETLVVDGSERIDEQLAKGVAELSSALDQGTRQVEDTFVSRTERIGATLATGLGSADTAFQNRLSELETAHGKHEEKLHAVFDSAVDALGSLIGDGGRLLSSASEQVRQQMVEGAARFSGSLGELRAQFNADLDSFATAAKASLTDAGADGVALLDSRMAEITEAVQSRVEAIYGSLDARTREFEANITQFGSNIDTQTTRLHRVISQKSEAIEQGIEMGIGRFDDSMQAHLQRAEAAMQQFVSEDAEVFQRQLTTLKGVLSDQTSTLEQRVNAIYAAMDTRSRQFESHVTEYGVQLEKQVNTLQGAIAQRSQRLEDSIELGTGLIDELLSKHIDQTQSVVSKFIDEEAQTFDRQIDVLSRTLDGRSQILDSIIRTRGADFTDQLYASSKQFEEQLTATSRALETTLRTGSGEMQEMLSGEVAGLQQVLEGGLQRTRAETSTYVSQLESLLTGNAGELKETFEKNATVLANTLTEHSSDIQHRLAGGTDQLSRALEQQSQRVAEVLAEGVASLDTDLGQRAIEMEKRLEARTRTIVTALDGSTRQVSSALDQASRELDDRSVALERVLEDGAGKISATLSQQSQRIVEVLDATSEDLGSNIGQRASALETQLESRTNAIIAALDGSAGKVGDALGQTSRELDGHSAVLKQVLEDGTGKITTTLAEQSQRLAHVLSEGAGGLNGDLAHRVADMETQLRAQTNAIVAALDGSAGKVGTAVEKASRELDKAARERVAEASATLERTLEAVTRSLNSGVDATQQQISANVDQLLARLAAHEKTAAGRMENAAANVGESTRKAAELTAERLVTLNGALVQVLNSLSTPRTAARKPKPEALPDAAE